MLRRLLIVLSLVVLAYGGFVFSSWALGGELSLAGIIPSDTTDTGPGTTDTGPGTTDTGPGTTDTGPGTTDTGPGTTDTGPGTTDTGPGTTTDPGTTTGPATTKGTPTTPPPEGGGNAPPTVRIEGPGGPLEANSPSGTVVFYTVNAYDREDGGLQPTCSPKSGAVFPLGPTTIVCTAKDSAGAKAKDSLAVTVVDTTAPVLVNPRSLAIKAPGPVSRFSQLVLAWLSYLDADDLVDTEPTATSDLPLLLQPGETLVTFTAIDDSGNAEARTATITVSATEGADPTSSEVPFDSQPDFPPGNVTNLSVTYGNRTVRLRWKPPTDPDFAYVELIREPGEDGQESDELYEGSKRTFRDSGLELGRQYRYLLVAYDEGGNRSTGVAIVVEGRVNALVAPADGATVRSAPRLRWRASSGATYYNVQLYRSGRKILSLWPRSQTVQLRQRWSFEGRSYKLGPGLYTWYVWPGVGKPSAGRYGTMLGQAEFVRK
jgi:hypothetical protein